MEAKKRFFNILKEETARYDCDQLALSGGLDSSAIAYTLNKPTPYCVISKDFVAFDLYYSQLVCNTLGLTMHMIKPDVSQLIDHISETIKILGNYNDIEIRNSLVMYEVIKEIKDQGKDSIITGDGADELFAGYDFLLKKSQQELQDDLDRIQNIMHFPSKKIGDVLGVKIHTPFLEESMIEFAKKLPTSQKVGMHNGKKYGKMIIRQAMEGKLPNQIVWRPKSPMQDGAGTAGLTEMLDRIIPDEHFLEKKIKILDEQNINIRTKESMFYYETFKKFYHVRQGTDNVCPDCKSSITQNTKFCRMCGRFPI